jgi:hypothetical protein
MEGGMEGLKESVSWLDWKKGWKGAVPEGGRERMAFVEL